jgi:glucose-6-phosphate 1-dehydrogenase
VQARTFLETNPLREGLRMARTPDPNVMVIFGATGDLTRRKLIPALYNLHASRLLPAGFSAVGFARRDWTSESFRDKMREACERYAALPVTLEVWDSFSRGLYYVRSSFDEREGYTRLDEVLRSLDRERGTAGNRVFYLATPPDQTPAIIDMLGAAGLAHRREGWTRLVVEKPFGDDLASARALNRHLRQVFPESEIYRIDHYLGKETVQDILVFRFANAIFEPIWDHHFVDHVQIAVTESVGMEGRGNYYDRTGALRDMVQNHLMQLLSLMAMEPPVTNEADMVRNEKVKVLKALRLPDVNQVPRLAVRGQYGPGYISGRPVPGYRQEPEVAPGSNTETYVALKLFVDNWRWADVPFYLRTGKRLTRRVSEIAVQFRRPPLKLFGEEIEPAESNVLALRIQPDEGISLRFAVKLPGLQLEVRPVSMDFLYGTTFGRTPEAYERLLLDCMLGDPTLFTRDDEVEAAWEYTTQIMRGWQMARQPEFPNYEAGTWGPYEAQQLIGSDGRRWRRF